MSEEIKQTYHGVEVEYDERENTWTFELRGKERSAASLKEAKEVIDKPEPKEKAPFEKIQAYHKRYSDDFNLVTVTSIALPWGYSNRKEVWISYVTKSSLQGDLRREKVDAAQVFSVNPDNDECVKQYRSFQATIDELKGHQEKVLKKLKKIKV